MKVTPDLPFLWADGIVCETISDFLPPGFDNTREFWQCFKPGNGRDTYPTGIPPLQALFRTLLMDNGKVRPQKDSAGGGTELSRLSAKPDDFADLAAAFFARLSYEATVFRGGQWQPNLDFNHIQAFLDWLGQDRGGRSDENILELFLGTHNPEFGSKLIWWGQRGQENEQAILWSFPALMWHYVDEQSFLITWSGYIGLGPKYVKVGDRICAFLGSRVLYVLRKAEDHYVLVGTCFMLGYMDGEALQAVEEGMATVETFEIP